MKVLRQRINDFLITNQFFRKIKIFFNVFIKKILFRSILFLILISIFLTIIIKTYKPRLAEQIKNKFSTYFYNYFKLNSLNFSKISISGNKRTKNEEIIFMIENFNNLKSSNAKLSNLSSENEFEIEVKNLIDEMKIKLPWLDKITIKRTMPDALNIEVTEYEPFAIWIHENEKFIINNDGQKIPFLSEYEQNAEFKNMIILSGKGANKKARSLFNILAINSRISREIYSANWVGNRRWDIRFYDGLIVKLPEAEIYEAWQNLIKFYHIFKNDKSIKSVDFRINDKIYVQYFDKKSDNFNAIRF